MLFCNRHKAKKKKLKESEEEKKGSDIRSTWDVKPISDAIIPIY